jgi:hypothetical protein
MDFSLTVSSLFSAVSFASSALISAAFDLTSASKSASSSTEQLSLSTQSASTDSGDIRAGTTTERGTKADAVAAHMRATTERMLF